MLYCEITKKGRKIDISKKIISVISSTKGEIPTVLEVCDWRTYLGIRGIDKWEHL